MIDASQLIFPSGGGEANPTDLSISRSGGDNSVDAEVVEWLRGSDIPDELVAEGNFESTLAWQLSGKSDPTETLRIKKKYSANEVPPGAFRVSAHRSVNDSLGQFSISNELHPGTHGLLNPSIVTNSAANHSSTNNTASIQTPTGYFANHNAATNSIGGHPQTGSEPPVGPKSYGEPLNHDQRVRADAQTADLSLATVDSSQAGRRETVRSEGLVEAPHLRQTAPILDSETEEVETRPNSENRRSLHLSQAKAEPVPLVMQGSTRPLEKLNPISEVDHDLVNKLDSQPPGKPPEPLVAGAKPGEMPLRLFGQTPEQQVMGPQSNTAHPAPQATEQPQAGKFAPILSTRVPDNGPGWTVVPPIEPTETQTDPLKLASSNEPPQQTKSEPVTVVCCEQVIKLEIAAAKNNQSTKTNDQPAIDGKMGTAPNPRQSTVEPSPTITPSEVNGQTAPRTATNDEVIPTRETGSTMPSSNVKCDSTPDSHGAGSPAESAKTASHSTLPDHSMVSQSGRKSTAVEIAASTMSASQSNLAASSPHPLASLETADLPPEQASLKTEQGFRDQVIEKLRPKLMAAQIGRSEIRLELDPPELGSLEVQIHRQGQGTRIAIETENPITQQILENNVRLLIESIEKAGINLQDVDISQKSYEQGRDHKQPDFNHQQRPKSEQREMAAAPVTQGGNESSVNMIA